MYGKANGHHHREGYLCNACGDGVKKERTIRSDTHASWDNGLIEQGYVALGYFPRMTAKTMCEEGRVTVDLIDEENPSCPECQARLFSGVVEHMITRNGKVKKYAYNY